MKTDVAIPTPEGDARAFVFTPDVGEGPWPAALLVDFLAGRPGRTLLPQLDREAGRYQAEEGDFGGAGGALGRQHLDRPALVVVPADVALPLEIGQMLVDGGQRLKGEVLGDLLETRRVSVTPDVGFEKREDFFLTLGECHEPSAVRVKPK